MVSSFIPVLPPGPIQFGTDGWRGVIAADFTIERLYGAAVAAAQVLGEVYGSAETQPKIMVGYDRRFLSETFAQTVALAVQAAGFQPVLADTYAPTPALSWAAYDQKALGALVITASHNPGHYSGLKVKGAFGGSVPPEITAKIEHLLQTTSPPAVPPAQTWETFNPWVSYCEVLRSKVNIGSIQAAVNSGKLRVFVDVMYGAAAGGMAQLLGVAVEELHGQRDPLFGGGAPEPLPRHLADLFRTIRSDRGPGLKVGLVFDGDADRIAAVDGSGEFLSSQVLIPILIEHLAVRQKLQGTVIKTVSGSDLMPKVAELYGCPVAETAVGYKYIADRMLTTAVLLGGEESGGIGYGNHIPERDGLLSALYLLEAMVESESELGQLYGQLQEKTGFSSAYDRIDLPLSSMAVRDRVQTTLQTTPPTTIAGQTVIDCLTTDGFKFRLADQRWLMVRFSGTEPLLRLYCEGATPKVVQETLAWAKEWASQL
ncbi:phosphoglucomutase/phosphomannomutase family protein [Prochlorothrix hollandica]|uniref:Phosphoglucosamine mutase n=1 Tax=Prochlorothrix hollandica PCC 9006 = CALU 1027 TaxID=317619 RepID=A0A0M2PUZ6_PROHO|nr:phosphoglucomutase/phosphomannomutase family protein [Prochlorothrix hollandica]KKI98473.1 phosphoglucosamine mutase [Prochlorothrix hollandica PCC 9006 = CALU 1027]